MEERQEETERGREREETERGRKGGGGKEGGRARERERIVHMYTQ